MNKVVHFEVPTDDLARAKTFYSGVFGWRLEDMPVGDDVYTAAITAPVDENYMMKEPGAINGGIFKRSADVPTPVITIEVESIDEHAKKIEAAGCSVFGEGEVPDMGYYAYFRDTEGNLMGLWETKKQRG